jgi:hypothetical protein
MTMTTTMTMMMMTTRKKNRNLENVQFENVLLERQHLHENAQSDVRRVMIDDLMWLNVRTCTASETLRP